MDTRAVRTTTAPSVASNITFTQQGHKPKDKNKGSEENKQFDPGGKGEKPPPWNAAVISTPYLCFSAGSVGPWEALCLCLMLFVCVCPSALLFKLLFFSGDHFSAS